MKPEYIPWLLCGVICILPLLAGIGGYYMMILLTGLSPIRDVTRYIKDDRRGVITEWSVITKEEKKHRNRKEEEEE